MKLKGYDSLAIIPAVTLIASGHHNHCCCCDRPTDRYAYGYPVSFTDTAAVAMTVTH